MTSASAGWMKPIDAVARLAPLLNGDDPAKHLIAGRLRDGKIRGTAALLTEGFDVGRVPCGDPAELAISLVESEADAGTKFVLSKHKLPIEGRLERGVWLYGVDWLKDLTRWDWGQGTFVFGRPSVVAGRNLPQHLPMRLRLPTRQVIYGVQLWSSDVEKLVNDFRSSLPQPIKRRAARKHDWAAVLIDLVAVAHVRGLDRQFGRSFDAQGWQAELERWIAQHFDDRNLEYGDQTVREHAQQVREAIARLSSGTA